MLQIQNVPIHASYEEVYLGEKTGGTEGLSKSDRGLKTQGLYKFANAYIQSVHHNTACVQIIFGCFNFGHHLNNNHSNSRSVP